MTEKRSHDGVGDLAVVRATIRDVADAARAEAQAGADVLGAGFLEEVRLRHQVRLARQAADYARRARAPATEKAYRSDLKHFDAWYALHGFTDINAAVVGMYLADLARHRKISTLQRRLAAIAARASLIGQPLDRKAPEIAQVMRGITNQHLAVVVRKAPLLTEDIKSIVGKIPLWGPERLTGLRDRAMILLGYAAAVRRSELVSLDVAKADEGRSWIESGETGLLLHLLGTKGDRERTGRTVAVPRTGTAWCPVAAVEAWCCAAMIETGPLFRRIRRWSVVSDDRLSGHAPAVILKARAKAAGLDPQAISGHSLRAGHATQAYATGVNEAAIQEQLGHRSSAMTRRYDRKVDPFKISSGGKVGL